MDSNSSNVFRIIKVAFVVVLSLAVLVGIFIALMSWSTNPVKETFNRNDNCKQQAMKIQENMDLSVDPCKDFFNFTCGNYKSNMVGEPNWLSTANILLFKRYLETVLNGTENLIPSTENLRDFHNACINIPNRNCKDDLKNVLIELQWPPLTKNWDSLAAGFNWLNLEEKLIKMGFTNCLLTFTSVTRDDTSEILVCDCGPTSRLSVLYDMTDEEVATSTIKQLIEFLEGDPKFAEEIAQNFIEIEKIKISRKSLFRDTSAASGTSELTITLGELENMWKINFVEFCISIFPNYMNITKSTNITFASDCPSRLVDYLMNSSKRPVAGYMLFEGMVEFIEMDWIKGNRQDKKILHGNSIIELRHPVCYVLNMKLFPDLWYIIYVKTYSSEASKSNILQMLNLILDEGKALINNSWLSDSSKKVTYNKLSKLKFMIDHDEEFVSDEYIQSTFGDLTFNASDLITSTIHLRAHRFLRQWKLFTLNVEKREILRQHDSLTVNAYNNRNLNMIIFPPPTIMPTLYSDDFEDYLNFGGLGSVLAHEIFHTLDKTSLLFDDNHNIASWLNEKDKPLFDEKINCFVKQYSNYELTSEFRVDGRRTIDENLADSGIILAYRAYIKWLNTNVVKRLPGLSDYSDRQIFWIAFANIYCESYTKEYLELVYHANDTHALGKFRVLGTLSNFEEFSADFNCPANSDMNPKNKCKLYD